MDQAVPLRINWALPYFSCQVAALTGYLSHGLGSAAEVRFSSNVFPLGSHRWVLRVLIHFLFLCVQMFCYLTLSVSTFTFLLLWEHAHYLLAVQAVCLLLLDSVDLVPARKVTDQVTRWSLDQVTL